MIVIVALQLILPLAVIAWLAFSPTRSWLTLALHIVAIALLIAALLLTGLWTVLPWWLPWLYSAVAALALFFALRKAPSAALPTRLAGWARLVPLIGLALFAGLFIWQGIKGRQLPAGPAVELAWPLPAGDYMIANGGANLSVSSHAETLDLSVARHRSWHGQSYGVDIVALNGAGRSARGGLQPADPRAYAIYGAPLLAPCAGTVVAARDGVSDNRVPDMPSLPDPGNHVLLRCGPYDVLLAHIRPGSVAVRVGQQVRTGQKLGAVGNSGSSGEPHLHIHAQTHGSTGQPFSGKPVPILFNGRWPVRGQRF